MARRPAAGQPVRYFRSHHEIAGRAGADFVLPGNPGVSAGYAPLDRDADGTADLGGITRAGAIPSAQAENALILLVTRYCRPRLVVAALAALIALFQTTAAFAH